jgi:hypothetical protein
MFSAGEARCDRWQDLAHAGQTLVAQSSSDSSTKETLATVEALLAPLSALETFRAYPGEAMMTALKDALGRRDYSSFSRITNRIARQSSLDRIVVPRMPGRLAKKERRKGTIA